MAEKGKDGLVLLDKPPGPTSHDLVQEVKRSLGVKKAGHAGTLDPLASGLLVILTGRCTRLAPFVPGDPKAYRGTIILGVETDTLDMEGEVIAERPFRGGAEEVREALLSLVGSWEQVPPRYSAAKHKGKPLYFYARRGEEVPRRPRLIRVYDVEMLDFRCEERVEVDFRVSCSPGTYVRDLARRLGEALGCGGTLGSLRRLASGPYRVEEAVSPRELRALQDEGTPVVLPPLEALRGYPKAELKREALRAARHGAPLSPNLLAEWKGAADGQYVAVTCDGELVGVYEVVMNPPRLRPRRIMLS